MSKDQYTVGSVWVADMTHVPYGVRRETFEHSWNEGLTGRNCATTVLGMACVVDLSCQLA